MRGKKVFACRKTETFLCYTSTARRLWGIEREIKRNFRFSSRGVVTVKRLTNCQKSGERRRQNQCRIQKKLKEMTANDKKIKNPDQD